MEAYDSFAEADAQAAFDREQELEEPDSDADNAPAEHDRVAELEQEVAKIVEHLKDQAQPIFDKQVVQDRTEKRELAELEQEIDAMYDDAVRIVVEMGKASTSTLQRRLRIGYGRAARLLDIMEREGIVGPPDGSKPRVVLKRKDYFREMDEARIE